MWYADGMFPGCLFSHSLTVLLSHDLGGASIQLFTDSFTGDNYYTFANKVGDDWIPEANVNIKHP